MIAEAAAPRCDHVVQFCDSDEELIKSVGAYVRVGLEAGEAAIVVATAAHRLGVEAILRDEVDPAAGGLPSVVFLDAEETLTSFLIDGALDRRAFEREIGGLARNAADGNRPVRIFGEMVALLWNRGLVPAAIELESYWNDLAREVPFSLFCAYSSEAVVADEHHLALQEICALHSHVIGAPAGCARDRPDVEVVRAFSGTQDAPGAARQFVFEALHERCAYRLVADAQLIVSELTTNAVIHAHSSFTVAITELEDAVRISVADNSSVLPKSNVGPLHATGGRGLQIVDALAARWSVETRPHGKIVWAEVRMTA